MHGLMSASGCKRLYRPTLRHDRFKALAGLSTFEVRLPPQSRPPAALLPTSARDPELASDSCRDRGFHLPEFQVTSRIGQPCAHRNLVP